MQLSDLKEMSVYNSVIDLDLVLSHILYINRFFPLPFLSG